MRMMIGYQKLLCYSMKRKGSEAAHDKLMEEEGQLLTRRLTMELFYYQQNIQLHYFPINISETSAINKKLSSNNHFDIYVILILV